MDLSLNAFSAGLGSIQSGQQRLDQAATRIAEGAATGGDAQAASTAQTADQLVQLNLARQQVEAGAKVAATVDDVLGTLIDIHA